jgi:multiple sugar transport system substrate-binding protein
MLSRAASFKMEANNALNGQWYSFPFRGYNFRLAWNKDMFRAAGLDPEKPPKTYAEVLSVSKTLADYGASQRPRKYAFMLPTGEDWIWWIYGMQMGRVNGDSYFDFNSGKFTWEAMKPVMEFWLSLKQAGALYPDGTAMMNDPARAQFSAGSVGMILAASWDIGVFNDQFPAEIEWGVTTLPNIDGTLRGYSQLDAGTYLHINNAGKYKAEAQAFHEYLLSEEVLTEYYEMGYGIPVYPGVAEKAKSIPSRPGFAGFATVENDRMYPYEPPVQLEGQGFGNVMNDVMNGVVSIDAAVADLNRRHVEAMARGIANGDFKLADYIIPGANPMQPFGK